MSIFFNVVIYCIWTPDFLPASLLFLLTAFFRLFPWPISKLLVFSGFCPMSSSSLLLNILPLKLIHSHCFTYYFSSNDSHAYTPQVSLGRCRSIPLSMSQFPFDGPNKSKCEFFSLKNYFCSLAQWMISSNTSSLKTVTQAIFSLIPTSNLFNIS